MTKDELEAAIETANLWSGRSTLVLAVGILGEYVLLPFLEKKSWLRPAKIFFAILVVAGIVGEYEFSSQISQHADELQRISDSELIDAAATARAAIERSGKLETANKQLGIDLEAEKQKTARFQKQADTARLALAKQLDDESATTANLSEQVVKQGPRRKLLMSEPVRNKLVNRLLSLAGQKMVVMYNAAADGEITDLLLPIASALLDAHWIFDRSKPAVQSEPNCCRSPGVVLGISQNAPESTRYAADALLSAFSDMPLEMSGPVQVFAPQFGHREPPTPDTIVVEIGRHP